MNSLATAFVTENSFAYTAHRFCHWETAMKLRYLFVLLWMIYAGWAQAEIYKSVDSEGHVTYSSVPMKGSKKLNLEPLPVMDSPRPRSEESQPFPKVNEQTQRKRDDTRRTILMNELEAEQKLLDDAKKNLQLAKDTPQVYRGKDGKTYRNVAKYESTVKAAQEQVNLHEKNIEAIQTELSRIK